jgi:hypothetical protein
VVVMVVIVVVVTVVVMVVIVVVVVVVAQSFMNYMLTQHSRGRLEMEQKLQSYCNNKSKQ